MKIHPTFHVSRLFRKRTSDDNDFPDRTPDRTPAVAPPQPDLRHGQRYDIDKILDDRTTRDNRTQYLVHWKNYPAYTTSWEYLEDLQPRFVTLIEDYERNSLSFSPPDSNNVPT
eukprot:Nk52_evm1s471 gene=Nk52_evmTU1s471